MEATFTPVEAIAVANAVYRTQGYIKKNQASFMEDDTRPNSAVVRDHFNNFIKVETVQQDYKTADEIISYLSGLSFKAMERGLTDFETNVLKFVTSETVSLKEVGIASSLPQVYDHKLSQDKWEQREAQLVATSDYVGTLNTRCTFELKIENVRYIGRTESYLYCLSDENENLVKFFHQKELGAEGDTLTVTGYVKSHSVSKFHGGKETMINRVKINK